jgi:hypothetical protein
MGHPNILWSVEVGRVGHPAQGDRKAKAFVMSSGISVGVLAESGANVVLEAK